MKVSSIINTIHIRLTIQRYVADYSANLILQKYITDYSTSFKFVTYTNYTNIYIDRLDLITKEDSYVLKTVCLCNNTLIRITI